MKIFQKIKTLIYKNNNLYIFLKNIDLKYLYKYLKKN